jgi:hypothetical protein
MGLAVRAGAEVLMSARVNVVFRTGQYSGRLVGAGVNVERAEAVVRSVVMSRNANAPIGTVIRGSVKVDGMVLDYQAFRLPDGTIRVGTIVPRP